MTAHTGGAFRSLKNPNYRIWTAGATISNIGTWMQRTAQDWLVLTELTHNHASDMGVVMALQFGPLFVLLPLTGFAADHFDRRKLLMITQAALGVLALGLGMLTITGLVRLWEVYVFALLLGCITAFDTPVRQSFVADIVGDEDMPNAVALNATSFNAARMLGPAVAGVLIPLIGSGWVFIVNALSFVAMLGALLSLKTETLNRGDRAGRPRGKLADGFRYAWHRPDILTVLMMLLLIGTFGINFPIFISTMAVIAFHAGPQQFGLLTTMMATGSVTGAFLSARRAKPSMGLLIVAATIFGGGFILGALMPSYILFGFALLIIGIAAQTFTTSANAIVQLSSEPHMRGRVLALFFAIAMGTTPIGAPIVGYVADRFGPRWALMSGAFAGISGALVGLRYWRRSTSLASSAAADRA